MLTTLTGAGFKACIFFEITNGIHFNYNCSEKIILKNNSEIKLLSHEDDENTHKRKPIKDCSKLEIELGVFDDKLIAESETQKFIGNLRVGLINMGCTYKGITYKIKDLSKLTLESNIECSLTIESLLKEFTINNEYNLANNTHFLKIIKLLEMAKESDKTILSFMLNVVALEAMFENKTYKEKSKPTVDFIDDIIKYAQSGSYSGDDKESLLNNIASLKKVGSRKAVGEQLKKLCGREVKEVNGKSKSYKGIYNNCYDIRNTFVHSGIVPEGVQDYYDPISKIALDVFNKLLRSGI